MAKQTGRYVTMDNGDGTHSVRDTVEDRWLELDGQEDMRPDQARSLVTEYELGDA